MTILGEGAPISGGREAILSGRKTTMSGGAAILGEVTMSGEMSTRERRQGQERNGTGWDSNITRSFGGLWPPCY